MKYILAWFIGVAFASSWWALPYIPKTEQGAEWVIPVFATIIMLCVAVHFFIQNWED